MAEFALIVRGGRSVFTPGVAGDGWEIARIIRVRSYVRRCAVAHPDEVQFLEDHE
jgi:hypothetical protein